MNRHRLLQFDFALHGLGLLVTIGLVVLAIGVVGTPMDRRQTQLQAQIVNLESLLGERHVVERMNESLQSDVDRRVGEWDGLLSRIPLEPQESDFLAALTELAGKSQLNVEFFSPGVTHSREKFQEMDVELQATGNYSSICQFLNGLNTMPRICNISKLEINSLAQIPGHYTVQISLRILFKFDDSTTEG
ncbi:MAG: type 4a pilus biogenesis protein PilO [Planctomycetaceae bacterium]